MKKLQNMTENERIRMYATDAEQILLASGHDKSNRHPFRSRSAHSMRVMKWAERLLAYHPEADREVLLCAAAFHDTGYAGEDRMDHQTASAILFRKYAEEHGMDPSFTEKTALCIATHSNKALMAEPEKLLIEQLLLMEADLLDEEGALSLCWDGLACGYENINSYEGAFEKTYSHMDAKHYNRLVTPEARAIWDEKAHFLDMYVQQMQRDLERY
ncbi:MAG: hypothetical protein CW338_03130 [Clostridiales bacterium]|nr:hypothetical protein [Clostridiales bacterium]